MKISSKEVLKLRNKTGVSVMNCKKALEEAKGDFDKATSILKKQSALVANEKEEKETSEGVIESYIHNNKKVGVMIELSCGTDFVAKNEEFKSLAHDLAMQIAATNPKYIQIKDAPSGTDKEVCLLNQEFIKDPTVKISDLINQKVAKFGENIQVKKFIRYKVGE